MIWGIQAKVTFLLIVLKKPLTKELPWTHEVEDSEIWWANERGEGLFSPGFYAQGYDQDERVTYSNDVDYYMTVSELSYN